MRVDVLLGGAPHAPADVADHLVVVIDVFRAATTAAVALAHGARAVLPCETVEAAALQAKSMDRESVRLGGERHMQRIDGFDFGNSPLEYTEAMVRDRTIVFTTTNGTRALAASQRALACYFTGFVNVQATVDALAEHVASAGARYATIVCSGTDGQLSLEDVVCAGRIVRLLQDTGVIEQLTDGARASMLIEAPYRDSTAALAYDATHGRALTAAGFGADVACCLTLDRFAHAVTSRDRLLRRSDLIVNMATAE
ncbi:MAG: 2-phosphosulfolactate phosphatase [Gemmatimonadaceae bacterium]|nr:2-phosphosulfolactate phosphatase [Gemmatimonadaceae bacterium]